MPNCRFCGAAFTASRAGSTVHCPKHRDPASRKKRVAKIVSGERPAAPGATCTIGPSAVTGRLCGEPGVISFTGSDGTVYTECARHHIVPLHRKEG